MSVYLLGVVTWSLRGRCLALSSKINRALACTWALFEYNMYARYKFHNEDTSSYMEDALRRCSTFEEVFFYGQAVDKLKATANALRTELVKKAKGDGETYAETWALCKKRCEMNSWQDYIA